MPDDWVVFVRLALACMFVLAAVAKLRGLDVFERTLAHLGLPSVLNRSTARLVPFIELAISVLLLMGGTIGGWGLLLAAALLVIFSVATLWAIAHRWRVSCSCFGVSQTRMSWPLVLRNLLLAAIASTVAVLQLSGQTASMAPWWHLLLLAPPAAAAGLIVPILSDAVEAFWEPRDTIGASR